MEVHYAAPVSELGLVYRVLGVVLATQVQHHESWGRPEFTTQSAHKRLSEGNLLLGGVRGANVIVCRSSSAGFILERGMCHACNFVEFIPPAERATYRAERLWEGAVNE